MASRIVTQPFTSGEKRILPFDFAADVLVGETISSATAVSVVYSGTDVSPDIINGAVTVSGTIASVTVGGSGKYGTVGVTYEILVEATKSTGEVVSMTTYCTWIPNLP